MIVKGRILVKCKECNRNFSVILSQKDKIKCCSRSCGSKLRQKTKRGKNNPHWRGGKKKKLCKYCKKEFLVSPSDSKLDKRIHCSRECFANSRINKIKIKCLECKKCFYTVLSKIKKGGSKHCSRKCYYKSRYNRIKVNCNICRKEFTVVPVILERGGGKFCSRKCYFKFRDKKVKCICKICGKRFKVKLKNIKNNGGKYCSRRCQHKSLFKGGEKETRKRRYNKIRNNPHLRLRQNISKLIWERLKSRLLNKNGKSTFNNILPYTIDDLMQHLESLFEPWMNWQNYGLGKGKWVIDHYIPDASFNYTSVDDEEFQKCWALDNLRPMEYIENIKKSNKII